MQHYPALRRARSQASPRNGCAEDNSAVDFGACDAAECQQPTRAPPGRALSKYLRAARDCVELLVRPITPSRAGARLRAGRRRQPRVCRRAPAAARRGGGARAQPRVGGGQQQAAQGGGAGRHRPPLHRDPRAREHSRARASQQRMRTRARERERASVCVGARHLSVVPTVWCQQHHTQVDTARSPRLWHPWCVCVGGCVRACMRGGCARAHTRWLCANARCAIARVLLLAHLWPLSL